MTLKETNRDCFYALLDQNLILLLPIVYTPTGLTLRGVDELMGRLSEPSDSMQSGRPASSGRRSYTGLPAFIYLSRIR